ncbi:TetR family transcriptional regulator [Cellulomonas palmilytica]|uniref:TetR family transcriptional regulator n=1 Tax=Cellulomonas palmilytica TaxID=2608402 RepID=UPI001F2ECE3E|nr:TetR family transcriptional regulator [Cellulomonas palmilytica]UJP41083.1 TetR family transcriptional regulator [Cellulomonas palmilytica]
MAPDVSLRERKRRAIQDEITDAAIGLFIKQGFDDTPVGQIAATVGMSERTFFRYFPTKDDVIEHVSARWRAQVAAALKARPDDERLWTSLRRAFDGYIATTLQQDRAMPLMKLVYLTPALRTRHSARMWLWRSDLTQVVRERRPELTEFAALTIVGAAVGCFETTREAWALAEGELEFDALLDEAMATVDDLP